MPDHNHGRTGVGDARRRGDRSRRLATSNLSFHNALGFGKSPSLESTTGSSKYSETKPRRLVEAPAGLRSRERLSS
jgi:hypothetical protein